MIYFDNASTSFPKAPGIGQVMAQFLAEDAANPGRAGHRMAVAVERLLDDVRLKLTRLFDGQDPHRMIFSMNCTDALNMAIKGVIQGGEPGCHVVTTVLEHNSVSRPLQSLANGKAIELTRVNCDDDGFVDPQKVGDAIRSNTRLIVMTHASNVLGTIQDVGAVGEIARAHDVLLLVDAAQTAGIVPISIRNMQIDFLAVPGHKSLLGPTGIGGLYVGERSPQPAKAVAVSHEAERLDAAVARSNYQNMQPWREGGTGGDSASPTQPALYPHYLEAGTPNTVGVVGMGASIDYVNQHSMRQWLVNEQAIVAAVMHRFGNDRRFTIYGTPDATRRVGVVSLNIEGYSALDVSSILDDSFNIAVRSGLHCAPYTHRRLGTFPDGTIRISPGPFSASEDLATLLEALDQIAG